MTKPNDLEFTNQFMDSIKDISPDSPAHIDWIYGMRARANLDTYAHLYTFPNTKGQYGLRDVIVELPNLKVEGSVKRIYQSNGLYREYMTKDNVPLVTIIATVTRSECNVSVIGCEAHVEAIANKLRDTFTIPKNVAITKLTGFTEHGPAMRTEEFSEDDPGLYFSKGEFYPYLNNGEGVDFDEFVKEYKKSKASVLLLIGPPGTGKSTFIRTLIFKMGMKDNVVVLGDTTIMNPAFTNFLHDTNPETLISIEDADNLCLPRDSGDGNYQMSSLLNFADGVVSVGSKVIIATNLSTLNKVDPALIRDGRAFKVLEFKELTQEEANVARVAVGLETVDFGKRDKITLASALNWRGEESNPLMPGVGFSS